MGATTNIGWTESTFNPWWGCERVSPACRFCYAEAFAKRTGNAVWGKEAPRRFFGDKHWAEPEKWNREAEARRTPHLVFCASMADVFEDRRDLDEHRARLFDLIGRTPWLRWQLLTKRPERVAGLVPAAWLSNWPAHAWIGTTVEDQDRADERVPYLLELPAPTKFLSCEPLLGCVDLSAWLHIRWLRDFDAGPNWRAAGGGWSHKFDELPPLRTIDWVIVGGESGGRRRALDLSYAVDLCQQVLAAGVPLFFKQVGGLHPTSGGDLIDVYGTGNPLQYRELPEPARRAK